MTGGRDLSWHQVVTAELLWSVLSLLSLLVLAVRGSSYQLEVLVISFGRNRSLERRKQSSGFDNGTSDRILFQSAMI